MKKAKTFLFAAVLIFCLLLSGCSGHITLTPEKPAEFEKGTQVSSDKQSILLQNSRFEFCFDTTHCTFSLTEKETGIVWSSNPAADYKDPIAANITKTDLQSQIIVTYKQDTTNLRTANSASSSVNKKNFTVATVTDGVRVDYKFKEDFTVPVIYTLNDDGFSATVVYSEITETEKNPIYSIQLLPYFGAASAEDAGYMFVPDGCGALIDFNNGKSDCGEYSKQVYGTDDSLSNYYETSRKEEIRLPVFGMKRNGGAFLAVIEEGDGFAYINATVSGVKTALNSVYATGVYRATDRLTILNGSLGTAGNSLYTALQPTNLSGLSVKYVFMHPENADYSGMATAYREYLTAKGDLNKSQLDLRFCAEIYGAVSKKMSVAGIQYNGLLKLTDFDEAKEILSLLKEKGINNIAVSYNGISKDGYYGKLDTDLKPLSKLGGSSGWKALNSYAEQNGMAVFANSDFYAFSKSGNGFSNIFDVSKSLDMSASAVWYKGLNTNIRDKSRGKRYLLKPSLYGEAADSIFKSAKKNRIAGIVFGDVSNRLSGDYSSQGIGRQMTESILRSAFEKSEIPLMFKTPNAYLLCCADMIKDLPVSSSENLIFDRDVPFYQMVIHGSVPYTGYAVNLNNSGEDIILRHIESLTGFTYAYMAASADKLQNTQYIDLYGLGNKDYKACTEAYKAFDKINSLVMNEYAVNHTANGKISAMTYANGVTVAVNYAETDGIYNGKTVPARGWAVLKDGNVELSGSEALLVE